MSESGIAKLRQDHGRIPIGPRPIVNFLLKQVEFHSKLQWDPAAKRSLSKKRWGRPVAFSHLIGTSKVRGVLHEGLLYFATHNKREGSQDEADRADISEAQARSYLKLFLSLQKGANIEYATLTEFLQGRLFWHDVKTKTEQCLCWDFPELRRCKHVLGLALAQNRTRLPDEYDPVLVCQPRSSRPTKGGDRYTKEVDEDTEPKITESKAEGIDDMLQQLHLFAAESRDAILAKRRATRSKPLRASSGARKTAKRRCDETPKGVCRSETQKRASSQAVISSRKRFCFKQPWPAPGCVVISSSEAHSGTHHTIQAPKGTSIAAALPAIASAAQKWQTRLWQLIPA